MTGLRCRFVGLAVVAAIVAGPGTAGAQDAAARVGLDRLRDSLDAVVDVAPLRQLERATIDSARRHRDDAVLHLRLGLVALRLHAIDSVSHVDDAISEFEWAASLQPDWPWPWFGLGLAEAEVRDRARSFAGGLWYMLGIDRESRSGAAFARAIRADPSFVGGLVAYARTALRQRIDAPLAPALEALRAATSTPIGWHPDLLVERGRLERLAGSPDSAVRMFSLATLLSRNVSLAWLELARTLPLVASRDDARGGGPSPMQVAYYAGAAGNVPEVVAMYRRDLEPIVSDSLLRTFDRLRDTARVRWLHEFWEQRDALELRSSGERLREHYRRWAVARRDFRLPPFRRVYDFGTELYRSGDPELDDRGVIWLRHGEPSVRIIWPRSRTTHRSRNGQALPPNHGNESWRYDRPDGALALHFVAETDPQDFRVVETPMLLDVPADVLVLRADEIPGLERLLRTGAESATRTWVSEDVRLLGRRSMAVATRTDSWERDYATPLTGRAEWFAVGVRDGRPMLHIVYTIDADVLREIPGVESMGTVPITVRAVAFDRSGRPLGTLDTVQRVPLPASNVRRIAMRAEFLVEAGTVGVRLGVEASEDVGAVYPVDSVVVSSTRGDSLVLGALLVGRTVGSLPWAVSAPDTAWLDPTGVYSRGDTLVVYSEAYGLQAGRPAAVRLTVTRLRRGVARILGREAVAISIAEQFRGTGAVTSIRRAVALGELASGAYALELVVEQGGTRSVRRRGIMIR